MTGEHCSNCKVFIPPSETPFIHEGEVLCADCYGIATRTISEPNIEPKHEVGHAAIATSSRSGASVDTNQLLREIVHNTAATRFWITFIGVLVLLALIAEIIRFFAIMVDAGRTH